MEDDFRAGRSALIRANIKDNSLTPPANFQPTTVKMTLWDVDRAEAGVTPSIVNSRLDTDITASCAAGVLTLTLDEADMALLDSAKNSERRGLLIYWDYNAGADSGERTIYFTVTRNGVPTA